VCVWGEFREKNPFSDKQSQIAERKTVGEQGPGDHGKEAAEQKGGGHLPPRLGCRIRPLEVPLALDAPALRTACPISTG
jgi:hypothetical protein